MTRWSGSECGRVGAVPGQLAEYTARQMLDHDASYGGSHLALALVLEHQGDARGAEREREAARRYWRDADRDLAELKLAARTW